MELRLPISELEVLLGEKFSPDDARQQDTLREFYGFLPDTTSVSVEDGHVVVAWSATSEAAKAEAERLAKKAALRAQKGEHGKARDILKAALAMDPSMTVARRDLAMVCIELEMADEAKDHLIEVLKLDPTDAWAFVILANHYMRQDEDFETAIRFLRRALELKPDDQWANSSLAAALIQSGQEEEGLKMCEAAMAAHPESSPPYMNKVILLVKRQDFRGASECLKTMFRCAVPQDTRSNEHFRQARDTFVKVQNILANNKRRQSEMLVDQVAARAGEVSGFPVKATTAPLEALIAAKIAMAWKRGSDHHLLTIREGDFPDILKDHHALHELHHVLMESEARVAGTNLWFITTRESRSAAVRAMDKEIRKLERKGYEAEAVARGITELLNGASLFLYNGPLDMFIEHRIRRDFPEIEEVQFCGVAQFAHEALSVTFNEKIRNFVPPTLQRINDTLNGAYAIFVDDLFGRATAFAEHYRKLPTFELSQRLFGEWRDSVASFQPGDEYKLVDCFADALGAREWYRWREDPAGR